MTFRAVALVILALACTRNEVSGVWCAGGRYELKLALSRQPSLTPELERYFNPPVDTLTLLLSVDSVVAAKAYGQVGGNARHFPVSFHAIGGDHFSAARNREHWTITINPDATDTGLALDGQLSHGTIAGNWVTRYPSPANGTFDLAPTT
jgi:hypothetical protein